MFFRFVTIRGLLYAEFCTLTLCTFPHPIFRAQPDPIYVFPKKLRCGVNRFDTNPTKKTKIARKAMGAGGCGKEDRLCRNFFRTTTRFASLPALHCGSRNPHPASPRGRRDPRGAACWDRAISGAGFSSVAHFRMTESAFENVLVRCIGGKKNKNRAEGDCGWKIRRGERLEG